MCGGGGGGGGAVGREREGEGGICVDKSKTLVDCVT